MTIAKYRACSPVEIATSEMSKKLVKDVPSTHPRLKPTQQTKMLDRVSTSSSTQLQNGRATFASLEFKDPPLNIFNQDENPLHHPIFPFPTTILTAGRRPSLLHIEAG
ncbi:unnamed protein product [Ixodes persulcatus]